MDLRNKKITIIGLGESGLSAALFLNKTGALVFVTDSSSSEQVKKNAEILKENNIRFEIGRHSEDFIKGSDFIVISPGVPAASKAVLTAKKLNIKIISEIELAYKFCKGRIVAITGTNGKSTTVTLLNEILNNAGKNSVLCGNIGDAFCGKIDQIDKNSFAVLEVSSFQLEYIDKFNPFISVILNVTQNHLDRHADFAEYFTAKNKIFKNHTQNNYIVLNYDDNNLKKLSPQVKSKKFYFSAKDKVRGAYFKDNSFFLNTDSEQFICGIDDVRLKHPHNVENFLAAGLCAGLCGVDAPSIARTFKTFKGLPHRIEFVKNIAGVDFFDDSKATTVNATQAALNSFDKKAVLIAGGRNKGSDFSDIRNDIIKKVKTIILIGEAADEIELALKNTVPIIKASGMQEAVAKAYQNAEQSNVVILSPMCASFDMYKSYHDRGNDFQRHVQQLNEVEPRSKAGH